MPFEHPVYFNKEEAKNWGAYYAASAQTGSGYRYLAGSGLPGFHGDIRQRGFGLPYSHLKQRGGIFPFGFLSKVLPVVGSIAYKSLKDPVKNLASDLISGKDPLESLGRAGLDSIKGVAKNVIGEITGQNGNGHTIISKRKRQKIVKTTLKKKSKKPKSKKRKLFR
jgi:hypothetical protein